MVVMKVALPICLICHPGNYFGDISRKRRHPFKRPLIRAPTVWSFTRWLKLVSRVLVIVEMTLLDRLLDSVGLA